MSNSATDTGTPPPSAQDVILGLALGYLPSRGLHVANELGIADLLKDGPRPIAELARATGAHQQSLYRLLRMLAGYGVFAEEIAWLIPAKPRCRRATDSST
jgi:Dimerisation domain